MSKKFYTINKIVRIKVRKMYNKNRKKKNI